MRLLPFLALALLPALTISLPAFAQPSPHAGHMSAKQQPALTDGLIKKIDKAAGEVVVQHGPLESIGMPPMTMAFGVADKRWINKLKTGDKIRFAAEMKAGSPVISRYQLAK